MNYREAARALAEAFGGLHPFSERPDATYFPYWIRSAVAECLFRLMPYGARLRLDPV